MKYLTWFLTSILLFQSTVSGVLAAKINQSEKPPAVTVKNPFRSLLLENKDLTSLTKSPSKPGTTRKKYSSQKKKQVLNTECDCRGAGKTAYTKSRFFFESKRIISGPQTEGYS